MTSSLPRPLRALLYRLRPALPDAAHARLTYRLQTGHRLDLSAPQRLSEKISWLKLYGMTPLHSFCADKITAPAYVAARLGPGQMAERIFATYDPARVTPARIGRSACMIKTGHDMGGTFPVRDCASEDWPALRARLRDRLGRNFYRTLRERQYRFIRPGILVEELLTSADVPVLSDIRVYCLNGAPAFLRITRFDVSGPVPRKLFGASYDLGWHRLDFGLDTDTGGDVPPPPDLAGILDKARILAEPFPLVRVDFLETGGRCLVGEMTFTPNAGIRAYLPASADLHWGAALDHRAGVPDWRIHLAAARAHLDACRLDPE